MGAFEFEHKPDLSARNCCFCGSSNENNEDNNEREETCIIAQKIFDQCRIQKCLNSDILGPARAARGSGNSCNDMLCEGDIIIPPCNAADVTIRDLELKRIEILRKKPNPLQRGCWDLELKYVFEYTLEFRRADGCFIGTIDATNTYHLRVTLFGSTEADVTTVTDQFEKGTSSGGPFVIAEGKAVALAADLRFPSCNSCSPCSCGCDSCNSVRNNGDAALGAPIAVNVTIGLFTIVKLFRTVNIVVNSLGSCVPERCTSSATNCDPCAGFDDIRFPMDLFSPTAEPRSCCGFGPIFGDPDCDCRERDRDRDRNRDRDRDRDRDKDNDRCNCR
ncbi:hypothetical protein [Anaerotignum sp.]|nr:hypothetical protein [Anaerotignum sp.]MBQ7758521.1 hypothetical protein [Anaerotignum sp.]